MDSREATATATTTTKQPQDTETPPAKTTADETPMISAADWVKGIALMTFSAILFSFNGALIKWASDIGYQSMQIFVFRSAMQLFVTLIASLFVYAPSSAFRLTISLQNIRVFKTVEKPLIKWIVLRGVFAGIAGICYFHAITVIPLGDAITVFSTYPLVAAFVGWIVLKERVSIIHGIALCAAIVGVYLIANGSESQLTSHAIATSTSLASTSWFHLYFGYILSVLAALTGGLVFIFIRLATKRTKPIILVYSHGFFCLLLSFVFGLIFQGFTWQSDKTLDTWIIIVCFGLVGYIGQWCMNMSTQLIPAAVSSLVRSSDSVFSYIWEVVIFSTMPTVETIIGAICVIIGIFLVSVEKLRIAYKLNSQASIHEDQITLKSGSQGKKIMLGQYGSVTGRSKSINANSDYDVTDYLFASNLSLDPNDSHVCLMARDSQK